MINAILANYATNHCNSKGRLIPEQPCELRTIFQRDRDRIVHSAAFRRLEYKTQVFINHEGDHYRTRLTHSLEVAQLARAMARKMRLDEDLAEAVALAHDLGHPPFGHAGEAGLKQVMQPYGGFDHNAQALRVVTKLEHRYAAFDGLNLTWETLEGLVKHNGALFAPHQIIADFDAIYPLNIASNAGLEAQIAAISDDIAYNNHDIEDGIRAGFFVVEDFTHIPAIAEILQQMRSQHGEINDVQRKVHEMLSRLIKLMVSDVISELQQNIAAYNIQTVEQVRALDFQIVQFSEAMEATNQAIKKFLLQNMYRHYRVNRMTQKAIRVVQDLFNFFMNAPECLPDSWRKTFLSVDNVNQPRIICDFIAGMTDRFALLEHKRLFNFYE
jgi:dGTPase